MVSMHERLKRFNRENILTISLEEKLKRKISQPFGKLFCKIKQEAHSGMVNDKKCCIWFANYYQPIDLLLYNVNKDNVRRVNKSI